MSGHVGSCRLKSGKVGCFKFCSARFNGAILHRFERFRGRFTVPAAFLEPGQTQKQVDFPAFGVSFVVNLGVWSIHVGSSLPKSGHGEKCRVHVGLSQTVFVFRLLLRSAFCVCRPLSGAILGPGSRSGVHGCDAQADHCAECQDRLGWVTSGCCGRGVSGASVSKLVTAGGCREFIPGPFIQSHCNTERLPFWRQFCVVFGFEFREIGWRWGFEDLRFGCIHKGAHGHPQGVPLRRDSRFSWLPTKAPTRGAPTEGCEFQLVANQGTHKGCPYRLIRGGGRLMRLRWLDCGEGRDFCRDTLHVFGLAVV